ncbi:MAG TPA: hypothetical protein VFK21_08680 [Gammaproteobacteria bacterium]|nr:hypothetical protein [Gammaproteobacteria bacterium]
MKRPSLSIIRPLGILSLLCLPLAWPLTASADDAPKYPAMAPVAQYHEASDAQEIALAKSAAAASISDHAEIKVLGAHGYETAVKGTNGFVCLVGRSWAMSFDNPEFWNPKIRTPICLNAASVRDSSVLPLYLTRTEWVLAGVSIADMQQRETAEWKDGRLTPPSAGDVTYMMSKDQYINDDAHPWHPHVMFFAPRKDKSQWGENLPGSPVQADCTNVAETCIFMVLVAKWSDGTLDPTYGSAGTHRM